MRNRKKERNGLVLGALTQRKEEERKKREKKKMCRSKSNMVVGRFDERCKKLKE